MGSRVLIADPYPGIVDALATALAQLGLDVVGSTHSPSAALSLCEALQPDIVVVDPDFMAMSTGAFLRRLTRVAPQASVIVFARNLETEVSARAAGIARIVLKREGGVEELVAVLRAVARFEPATGPAGQERSAASEGATTSRNEGLTRTE